MGKNGVPKGAVKVCEGKIWPPFLLPSPIPFIPFSLSLSSSLHSVCSYSFRSTVIQPSYIFKVFFFFGIILAVCSKCLFDSLMTPLFLNVAILDRHEIILLSSWVVFVLSPAKRVDEKKGEERLLSTLVALFIFFFLSFGLCFKGQISLLSCFEETCYQMSDLKDSKSSCSQCLSIYRD